MKTLAQLQMSGTLADHPKRYANRMNEPQPKVPLGSPPSDLAPELRKFWNEIRKMLGCMPGVAVYPDRYTVERLCRLVYKMRNNTLTVGEGAQMLTYLDKLGMTPQGRCRLQVTPDPKKKDESPFAAFSKPVAVMPKTGS